MRFSILRSLQIRREEEKPVLLLVLYSFFMGAAIAFFYTASISLFLHCFQRDMLPLVYIAGGLVIYLFGLLYRYSQKHLEISKILTSGIFFLLITSALITVGYMLTENKWIAFLMFVWINVFLFIHGVGFNGIASRLFTLQQGKRLYSIIGVGEVVSNVLGFFSVPILLRFMKTEHLPGITIIALILALVTLLIITSTYKHELSGKTAIKKASKGVKRQFSLFIRNTYTLNLFILALLPVFGLYFVDFVFFGQSQLAFPQKEVLSGFIGIFFGIMALVEFIIKTFAYSRVIEKFGVKPGLVALPLTLLFSTLLASISGTLWGVASMFSFVVLSKLFIRSVKNAVNDPSYLILYQVLPSNERFAFQAKVEGGPKAVSNIIVGLVIILLTQLHFSLVHFNYVFILVLAFWTWAAFRMYGQYKFQLKKILRRQLFSTSADESAKEEHTRPSLVVPEADHLESAGSFHLLIRMDPYTAFEMAVQRDDHNVFPLHELSTLITSHNPADRSLAARQLGSSGRYQAVTYLRELMLDETQDVRKTAIISSGRIKSQELFPLLINNLSFDEYARLSCKAITNIGIPVLKDLDALLKKTDTSGLIKCMLIKIFGEIGGKEGINRLKSLINHPDYSIRKAVFRALGQNNYIASRSETLLIKESIEEEIGFIVWATACKRDLTGFPEASALADAIQAEADNTKQLLFLLMSLIFEPALMNHIRAQFKQGTNEAKVYALELFGMMVTAEIKELVIPLLEELSIQETLTAYQYRFPQEKLGLKERLADVLNKDHSRVSTWSKANAVLILEQFPLSETANLLMANLSHPDQLLRETTAEILFRLDPDRVISKVSKYQINEKTTLLNLIESLKDRPPDVPVTLMEKIKLLRSISLFSEVPETELAAIMQTATIKTIPASAKIEIPDSHKVEKICMLTGDMDVMDGKKPRYKLKAGTLVGDLSENIYYFRSLTYISREEAFLIILDAEKVYALFEHDPALMKKYLLSINYESPPKTTNYVES